MKGIFNSIGFTSSPHLFYLTGPPRFPGSQFSMALYGNAQFLGHAQTMHGWWSLHVGPTESSPNRDGHPSHWCHKWAMLNCGHDASTAVKRPIPWAFNPFKDHNVFLSSFNQIDPRVTGVTRGLIWLDDGRYGTSSLCMPYMHRQNFVLIIFLCVKYNHENVLIFRPVMAVMVVKELINMMSI